jgi:hypothetical protein
MIWGFKPSSCLRFLIDSVILLLVVVPTFADANSAVKDLSISQNAIKQTNDALASTHELSSLNISTKSVVDFDEIQQRLTQTSTPFNTVTTAEFYIKYQIATLPTLNADNLTANFSSAIFTSYANEFSLTNANIVSAGYQYGNFSAETGIVNEQMISIDGERLYLQGAYQILSFEKFSLSVAAKVETIDSQLLSYDAFHHEPAIQQNNTINSSLGLIGKYQLTKQWSVVGTLSASSLNNHSETHNAPLPLIDNSMAVIGTRYTF